MNKKKRPRAKKLPKQYKGYMEYPLVGARTHAEFLGSTRYYGDFACPHTRHKIFNRDRLYRVELCLRLIDSEGNGWSVLDMSPDNALNKRQLAELIQQIAYNEVKDLIDKKLPISVENSYIKVIL